MRLLLAGPLLCLACGESKSDSKKEPVLCDEANANLELLHEIEELLPHYTSCEVDQDCTQVTPKLECPDAESGIGNCPMAISVTEAEAFLDEVSAFGEDLRSRIEHNCRAGSNCILAEPVCIEKDCTMKQVGED